GLFSIMFICLRTVAEKYLLANNQEKILLLTNNKELSEKLKQEVESLGAEILWLTEDFSKDLDLFQKTIEDEKIKIIIADSLFQEEKIYKRIAEFKIELLRPETFFEKKLRKIYLDSPTFELSQIKKDSFTKEIVERSMALMLIIVSSPILLFIAVAIKLSSPGPMI
ncbi:MAG: Exopolysaccharide biosynthesis polyprenyl glycosylphosphotransferase, partial [Parcubacteria group bacterium GW2011_GWB1_41_4]